MESPGNSNGQRTVSGSPGRAEQGVAGIPPGMDAHCLGSVSIGVSGICWSRFGLLVVSNKDF